MTQYLIRRKELHYHEYLIVLGEQSWTWTQHAANATRFDSMTETELYALTADLRRYTVCPVHTGDPAPVPTHDLGGESGV